MTIEQMRRLYSARPFEPFTIHLADGRALPVLSPELMSFSASGRTIVVYHKDAFDIVDLLLVTSLEVQSKETTRRRRN